MDLSPAARLPRPGFAALLAALLAWSLLGVAPGGTGEVPRGTETGRYIVRAGAGELAQVGREVAALGGHVERRLTQVGAAVVTLPRSVVDTLRDRRGVLGVTPDSSLRLQGERYDAGGDAGSMFSVAQITGARRAWASGITGSGVGVALIDSGVARVPGLDSRGKVARGPDLSFESQDWSTRHVDTFGHGTFMAGIIAGNDGWSGSSAYNGMAPGARLVSLKVADANGNADVSQVIAAIDWVVQHRDDDGLNIRVLNLSFGTPSRQSYLLDPLAYAAEIAWHKGIVVVVSAGNDGTGTGKLLNPAQDPFVLAVGASNSSGTLGISDDTIPDFSTRGDGVRDPDVVAPGTSLQGLRVRGSFIDERFGATAALDDRYFRGSGTSQAAAVVSGAAALLLDQRPGLSPDQVKAMLTRSARFLPAANQQAQGYGLVDVAGALQAPTPWVRQSFARSTGTGSLDAARGGVRLISDGVVLDGERDIFGKPYVTATRALQQAAGSSWAGNVWNGSSWAGSSWAGSSWAGSSWAGSSWAGSSWAGSSWAGSSWAGSSWASAGWG